MSGDKKEECGYEKVAYERDVDGDGKDMYGDDKEKSCDESDVFYDANDTFDTSRDEKDESRDEDGESHDDESYEEGDESYEEGDESYEEGDESCDETGESYHEEDESCEDSQGAGDSVGDAAECSASNEVTSEEKEEKNIREAELEEEAKFLSKYPGRKDSKRSAFLKKRLNKGNKYFDSGDYNMAKAQGQNADGSPDRDVKPTGDVIPTVDKLPPRHAIAGPSKLVTKTSP